VSAEILRRAAALMHERAEAASPLHEPMPARVDIDHEGTCDGCARLVRLVASYPEPDSDPWVCAECAAVADHESSWHPVVALAVAKAMDDVAHAWEIANEANEGWVYDPDNDPLPFEETVDAGWLTVARAYLGGDA